MVRTADKTKASKVSLQYVLIVPFVIEIVLIAGLVGAISYQNGLRAVNNVAHRLQEEITDSIEQHLDTFLLTPHQVNAMNAGIINQGLLDVSNAESLERYLLEQIQLYDSLTSVYFGNTDGGLVNAGREGADGDLYVILTDDFSAGNFNKHAVTADGTHQELLAAVPDFDARTRPWYRNAVEQQSAAWTEVYILFTGQDMAVSASRPVYDESGDLLGVVSSDIFMSHLNQFLRGLEIGKTGTAFIMERSGELIASSTDTAMFLIPGDESPRRLGARESSNEVISSVARRIHEIHGGYEGIEAGKHFDFNSGAGRQYVQITPIQDEYGIDWLVVVVIPEVDFMAQIITGNRITIGLITVSIVIAVLMGIFTARYVTDPVLRLNTSARELADGRWEVSTGSQWILEIHELASSFNHMVDRLKATMMDLKAEILQKNRAEDALRKRLRYEEGLSACSKALLEDNPGALKSALQFLLDAMNVSRIYLYRNVTRNGRLCMQRVEEVHSSGTTPLNETDYFNNMPYDSVLPDLRPQLFAGESVGGRVDSFPDKIRNMLQEHGVLSHLLLPIHVSRTWYGFLGFDDTVNEREWQKKDLHLFSTAAELVANYLERKQAQQAVLDKSLEQQTLLDSMDAQVWYLVDSQTYGMVNQAHADFYGLEKEDMQYRQLNEIFDADTSEEYLSRNSEVFNCRSTIRSERWVMNSRGEERLLMLTRTPGLNQEGEVEYVVCVATDETERARMEQQLRQQDRLASVGQLAAGIAHDFNNIITAIVLYTQMSLQSTELPDLLRDRLTVIENQADRAAHLVQQILDFGRRTVLKHEVLDLADFLTDTVAMLERTLPESISVDLKIEPGRHVVQADPTRFQQVIVNLALNARDAMQDGGELEVHLSQVVDTPIECQDCGVVEGGSWVLVRVRDNGSGIAPDVLPNILEPFFTTKAPHGHGLGLAQVYGIMKQHGGHLDVETEYGLGTAITLYWPLFAGVPVSAAKVEAAAVKGKGELLLVVEDSSPMRAALVDVLEMLGYRVLEAADGEDALHLCRQHGTTIDLIISDWVMPRMGGLELVRKLAEQLPSVKVLLLTGHPLDEEKRAEVPGNVIDFLLKPPSLESLAREVYRALRKGDTD